MSASFSAFSISTASAYAWLDEKKNNKKFREVSPDKNQIPKLSLIMHNDFNNFY